MSIEMRKIVVTRGSRDSIELAVATFNGSFSHFVVDDNCYQLVNGNEISAHLFPEAVQVLKALPSNPNDCYLLPDTKVEQKALGLYAPLEGEAENEG